MSWNPLVQTPLLGQQDRYADWHQNRQDLEKELDAGYVIMLLCDIGHFDSEEHVQRDRLVKHLQVQAAKFVAQGMVDA